MSTAAVGMALTRDEARGIMLAAQGLFEKPHVRAGADELQEVVERLGVVQIDTINVVRRSQYLVLWSRLGSYDAAAFDSLLYPRRTVLEYWAHAASILPMRDFPYHQAWMRHHAQHMWAGNRQWMNDHPEIVRETREMLEQRGPLASADIERPAGGRRTGAWDWYGPKEHRRALDVLWTSGEVMVHSRRGGQKLFDLRDRVLADLAERVLPEDGVLPSLEQRRRYLAQRTLEALGVVTPSWLWDYFRLSPPRGQGRRPAALALLQEFVREGLSVPAEVEGLEEPAFVSRQLLPALEAHRRGARPERTTLLSPFDSLLWHRERAQALFDYEVCFEAYVAPPKRRYGYYCLAILHRGAIVGRIDPKMDRSARSLLIRALYLEPGMIVEGDLLDGLAEALRDLARFLGAKRVLIGDRVPPMIGDLLHDRLPDL